MRMPSDIRWDREVVYECVWSLLCAVGRHNESAGEGERVDSILMTPLGTGTGGLSEERWANQVALALKHYLAAGVDQAKWSGLRWEDAGLLALEVQKTWKD